MKPTPTLLAASSLLALLSPSTAHAETVHTEDGILTFDLAKPQWAESTNALDTAERAPEPDPLNQPLPIPARAANPPMRYHSPQQLPTGVYRRGVAVGLNESTSATALLPPAPPLPEAPVMVAVASGALVPTTAPKADPQDLEPQGSEILDFALAPSTAMAVAQAKLATPPWANPLPSLFEGNSDSLVAWAVGSAEGTRTPNGAMNQAYFGHTDPGNRAWNMGTFSYQHGAATPEEADQKQLSRLKNQGEILRQRALTHGLNLTLEETLNGLDLANQSPLAALGRVGYIERLAEAKANGHERTEAIVIARTRAYINPKTGRWNAPGLGNTEASIRRDQQRRANAVAQVIAAYHAQNPALQPQTWALAPPPETSITLGDTPTEPVDDMLYMWTSPSDPIAQAQAAPDDVLAVVPPLSRLADDGGTEHPSDAPLAALWQITVKGVSQAQAALPPTFPTPPQTASLATVLFNRGGAPTTKALESKSPATAIPAVEAGDLDHPEFAAPAAALAPKPTAESAAAPKIDPIAIVPPTWTTVREGSQTTPPTDPTSGAFPDSMVYSPSPHAAPATAPALLSGVATQPELLAPALSVDASTSAPTPVLGTITTLMDPDLASVPEAWPPVRASAVP